MATAFQVAAELAAAADIRDDVVDAAMGAAESIRDEWMQMTPSSPGGYQGAGFTGSPGANKAEKIDDGGKVGAEVYNQSFVAWFLQAGTAHHGPKVDYIGAADPHMDKFVQKVSGQVGL